MANPYDSGHQYRVLRHAIPHLNATLPNKTLLSTANSFLSSRSLSVVCGCLSGIGASREFELAARELDVLQNNMRIFLDPDGTEDLGLCLLVPSATGISYTNQCGGVACIENSLEGFIVPLGRRNFEQEIFDFFIREFDENCYPPYNEWSESRIEELSSIISKVPVSKENNHGDIERREFLKLDAERMKECVEAWIPVLSVYGKAVLVLKNSD